MTVTFYDQTGVALYNFSKAATRAGTALAAPVKGKYGSRSGLFVVLLLAALGGAGAWHWKGIAEAPPEEEEKKKVLVKRKPEAQPLLPADKQRFNTFNL